MLVASATASITVAMIMGFLAGIAARFRLRAARLGFGAARLGFGATGFRLGAAFRLGLRAASLLVASTAIIGMVGVAVAVSARFFTGTAL